jgi:hypothetical protein
MLGCLRRVEHEELGDVSGVKVIKGFARPHTSLPLSSAVFFGSPLAVVLSHPIIFASPAPQNADGQLAGRPTPGRRAGRARVL